MSTTKRSEFGASLCVALTLAHGLGLTLWTGAARAQEAQELGWFFTAEVTGVWTSGNSESSTLGLDTTIRHVWSRSTLKFEGGAIRSESSLTTRTAVGTPDGFDLSEETVTEKTAEAYYVRGRYDYDLSERFFLFTGGDWLRNTFSGINSRFLMAVGAGNSWISRERLRFKTDYSATYAFEEAVVDNPFMKANFPGVRVAYDLWTRLTGSTEFTSVLIADWNLDNTDDIRLDFTNALPIAISSVLAVKPSLQLLWRNDPSLTEVPLEAPDGSPTGMRVPVPLDKLDSFLKLALVFKM